VTYRIHRSAEADRVVFTLSGDVDNEHAEGLEELLASEANDRTVLDFTDVTLVDRMAVQFLAVLEDRGVRFVNCPGYVRSWIAAERALRTGEDGAHE